MWNFLGNTADTNGQPETEACSTDYVHTLVLDGIDDPFNAAQLWHKAIPMMGSGSRTKGFLASHPYRIGVHDHVYAHVMIEIPPRIMASDRILAKGQQSESLIRELVKLHLTDFGKRLEPGVTPRYLVRAGHDLDARSVRIRIGHTIYVPDTSEPMAWRLEGSRNGIIFEPLGDLGQMQRLTLLGAHFDTASIQIAKWPWGERHALLIVNNPEAEHLSFDAEPFESLKITQDALLGDYVISEGKEKYILRASRLIPPLALGKPEIRLFPDPPKSTSRSDAGLLPVDVIEWESDGQNKATIIEQPRLLDPGSVMPVLQSGESSNADESQSDSHQATWVGGLESSHAMKLVGLGLQRVSLYKSHGVTGMGFGFDRAGQLLPPRDPRSQVRFHIDTSDRLIVLTGDGKRQVQTGEKLPLSAEVLVQFDAPPKEMQDTYAVLCRLPIQMADNIGADACFSVGREKPVLKTLRPLARKGYIDADERWASADRMGLSREAFAMEVIKEGLAITQVGDNQVLYHLDEALGFVARIDKRSQPAFTLPSGHHLVAGPYVWRYECPR